MKTLKDGESCKECGHRSDIYNGWSNYETWNVALWIDNEQSSQEYWNEKARNVLQKAQPSYHGETRQEAATCLLAREIENEIKEGQPEVAGTYGDLLGAALSMVDWYEIAEHMINGVLEEVTPK